MDALLLHAVVGALQREWTGATILRISPDVGGRLRIDLENQDRRGAIWVSLHSQNRWVSAAPARDSGERPARDLGDLPTRLQGNRILSIAQPGFDRWISMPLSDGSQWVIELAPHRRGLIIEREGRVLARWPHKPGATWEALTPPRRAMRVDLHSSSAILKALTEGQTDHPSPWETVAQLMGMNAEATALLQQELSTQDLPTIAEALGSRVKDLWEGWRLPHWESEVSLRTLEKAKGSYQISKQVMPWGPRLEQRGNAARYFARLHSAWDRVDAALERRKQLVRSIDHGERKLRNAMDSVRAEFSAFEKQEDDWKRMGEALLAGMHQATRNEQGVTVPDPWNPDQSLFIPSEKGEPIPELANRAFEKHRRTERGLSQTKQRLKQLEQSLEKLSELGHAVESAPQTFEALEALEDQGRSLGLLVGLRPIKKERVMDKAHGKRLPGVRVFCAPSGETVLVGKGARDNDRLTFKIASPNDFWLHAHGSPGAHVILRNPEQNKRPDKNDLVYSAQVAAWFSEQRTQGGVDVSWTLRKYVRRIRGGPPGLVKLKRHEILRVKPKQPNDPLLDS